MTIGSQLGALLPILITIVWACVVLLVDLALPADRKGWNAPLAVVGLIGATAAVASQFGQQASAFGGMILVDTYSSFLQALFLVTAILGVALAYDYLDRMSIQRGEYYSLLLFATSGMMLMAMAGDLIVVFLALELLSIPLYVLSGFARPRRASEEAAMKYFLLGAFSSGFVVYGIALVFGQTGSTLLADVAGSLTESMLSNPVLLVGLALIVVGLGFKVAAVPFHMWTPDVYQGAPSPVVGYMSVGAKAAGFAALLRVLISGFPDLASAWGPILLWVSVLTMAWGNIAAIAQSNIKRMLAYSSIAHAGYILMALPAAAQPGIAPEAVRAALFYLLAYLATNLGAWGVVVALEKAEGRGLTLEDYSGLAERYPALAAAMAVFMLSLIGVPPTAGFVGKLYVFRAAISADLIGLAIVGVLTSLVSAYYYLRVVVMMYMRSGQVEARRELWLAAAVGATALATLLLGIFPGPLLELTAQTGLMALLP